MPIGGDLSIIVPTLNAAGSLPATLASVRGEGPEVIVADGGSTDGTCEAAGKCGARVLEVPSGRGVQFAAGVAAARGPWLLLLHADTRLAAGWAEAVEAHMAADRVRAAYFRLVLDSPAHRARLLERAVEWRCRLFALPYGDQGLLIHRDLLAEIGGISSLPLMEDVDLALRLGSKRLVRLPAAAVTSAEKWERQGWYRRSARNLYCLFLYFLGVPTDRIARVYR